MLGNKTIGKVKRKAAITITDEIMVIMDSMKQMFR